MKHARECGASVYERTRVNSIQFSDDSRPTSVSWTQTIPLGSNSKSLTSITGTTSFSYLIDASGRAGVLSTSYLKNRHFNAALKNIALWGYWRDVGKYGVGTPREGAPWFEALTGRPCFRTNNQFFGLIAIFRWLWLGVVHPTEQWAHLCRDRDEPETIQQEG